MEHLSIYQPVFLKNNYLILVIYPNVTMLWCNIGIDDHNFYFSFRLELWEDRLGNVIRSLLLSPTERKGSRSEARKPNIFDVHWKKFARKFESIKCIGLFGLLTVSVRWDSLKPYLCWLAWPTIISVNLSITNFPILSATFWGSENWDKGTDVPEKKRISVNVNFIFVQALYDIYKRLCNKNGTGPEICH